MTTETDTLPLLPGLAEAVLAHLGVALAPPSAELLHTLLNAYVRNVPWESAFRIVKRNRTMRTANCPRWPDEFWDDHLTHGGGGTCFESNYALFRLLRAMGFRGYLTINNMGDSIGCHTAIVVYIGEARWLIDVGIPLYTVIPLGADHSTQHESLFHTYTLTPTGSREYEVTRDRHPVPYVFTLLDRPVTDLAYRVATTEDYGSNGRFLNRLIVNRIIDDTPWRFNSAESLDYFTWFKNGQRFEQPISGDRAEAIGDRFGMDIGVVHQALEIVTGG